MLRRHRAGHLKIRQVRTRHRASTGVQPLPRRRVQQWAFTSLRWSGWAREFYDTKIAVGNSHHKALRALGNRWLELLWHCLTHNIAYDENIHVANRNRAPGHTTDPKPPPDNEVDKGCLTARRRRRPAQGAGSTRTHS